ncbi:MAG: hypothetical protein AAB456_00295 [Patescibacteria group bacterium]
MALTICDDRRHDDIVFEDTKRRLNPCPLCNAIEEIEELQKELNKLQTF